MSAGPDKSEDGRAAPTSGRSAEGRAPRDEAGSAFFRAPAAPNQPGRLAAARLRETRIPRRDAPSAPALPADEKTSRARQQPPSATPVAPRSTAAPSPAQRPAVNPPAPAGAPVPRAAPARPGTAKAATAVVAEPSATPPPARHAPHSAVMITDFSCGVLDDASQQSLGVTYWFDAEPAGDPYTATVHFRGRLKGVASEDGGSARPAGRTEFAVTSTLENVLPGSGRIALTTRIPKVAAGEWEVVATPVRPAPPDAPAPWVEVRSPRLPQGAASGRTAFSPIVDNLAPGVRLGAWPALVGMGFVLALVLQSLLARELDLPGLRLFLLTAVASSLGLAGAKVYYLLTHPRKLRSFLTTGLSVQGFVITTLGTLVAGSFLLDLPLGAVLDVTAPGLLFAMAIGRLGCLLGGCCVGRPTSSRWGIWSSDRRVGVRRIPVQLLESGLSAALGALALLAVLLAPARGTGLVLVATVSAYVLGRQILFPLRDIPRATAHGRSVSLVAAAVALLASLVPLLLR